MPGPEADLALLAEVAVEAGRIALRYHGASPRVWDKGEGQGPVTEADLAVNDFLHATLTAARPVYGWMSEESDPLSDLTRLGRETLFVVDPIDGTRAFIDGQPGFAHALAVVHRGKPVAGVVHLPALGLTYGASASGGAWLNGAPIHASGREAADGAAALVARAVMERSHWPGGMPALDRHFRPSLAWRLALIGEGRFDAMLTIRDAWDWDIAASALIATEAGARVSDRAGRELIFNRPEARNPGVIAAPPVLHAALIRGLNHAGPPVLRPSPQHPSAQ